MARTPKPWYRKDRKCWFVTINGQRHNLGKDREAAFHRFHELMAQPTLTPKVVESQTVVSVIDAFLEWCLKHRAERTYEWYLQRCQWFIETITPSLTTNELKPYHVQQWVDGNPHWSDGHKRGCMRAVQRPMNWATTMGLVDKNPIRHLEKPQEGQRDLVITKTKYDEILEYFSDQAFRDLLITAWETGARPQELLAVEKRHVDLENARWIFPKEEAKGKRQQRVIYLSDKAFEITQRRYVVTQDGHLFRNRDGKAWTPYAVNCRFCRLQKKIGTKYCLYLFRHSFATRMLEKGMDAVTVAVLMGHRDTTMLGRVYQHLSHNPKNLLEQVRKAAS